MDLSIAVFLAQDGIAQGTIYMLLAIALVLVFSVTRIILVPQGDFVTYGALTLASLQLGLFPGTIWVLLALSLCMVVLDIARAILGQCSGLRVVKSLAMIAYSVSLVAISKSVDLRAQHTLVQIVLTLAIVAPMGPCIYRIAFEPLAQSSELVLLIAAVAVHFVMVGGGLVVFGPEGFRTAEVVGRSLEFGQVTISGQSLAVFSFGLSLIVVLYLFMIKTMPGKALMATAINRTGAKLVGIDLESSGNRCFLIAAAVGALSGALISSVTTIYYDSGFLIVLKGFVAAIFGGLSSYPLTAIGALSVGLIEAFSSFWTSAFKEAVLFSLIVPILLCRSLVTRTLSGDRP